MALRNLIRISAGSGELLLCPSRAAFDPVRRSLFVADVHLGKALSFRALGVPVPGGTTALTLTRLGDLLATLDVNTLFFLGDLLHGPAVRDSGVIDQLQLWRKQHSGIRMVLVRGNHDQRAGDPPPRCGIEVFADGVVDGPWVLRHEVAPEPSSADDAGDDRTTAQRDDAEQCGYVLSGHVHPYYRLRGKADSVRLPAFLIGQRRAVLPAFGEFTGGVQASVTRGDRVFVTDGQDVHPVTRISRVTA